MVRLNRNQLSDKQLVALFGQFILILNPKAPAETENILSEVLGYEEKIMISKRLVAIVLLIEGKSLYSVSNTLKISSATALTIKRKLDAGEYTAIIRRLGLSKKNYFAILDTIDSILHLGGILPHYNGLDRYRL
jgi:uncharacterized protein YerC